jgi:hypothetical protein
MRLKKSRLRITAKLGCLCRLGVKTRKAQNGQMFSGLPPQADFRSARTRSRSQPSINIIRSMVLELAVDQRFTQTRRASDTKAASGDLPPGSGDVGPDARAGPVHEVQERLVLHPRGHRPDAAARGRAADGVERGQAAKGVTDPVPRRPSPGADGRGPRRVTYGARPFDGTTGG